MSKSKRTATCERQTAETALAATLRLDGGGMLDGESGVGFFDHLLTAFIFHSRLDLTLTVTRSDLYIDEHHTLEDLGIVLGQALRDALGDKAGIRRYGDSLLPMDDALVQSAVDVGGRFWFSLTDAQGAPYNFRREKIGSLGTEIIAEFLRAFALNAGLNLHIRVLAGANEHHVAEAIFKSVGRALRQAVDIDKSLKDQIPSTKGKLRA
jgi:imidazoleglycerol-phosphate dehydratase